MDGLRTVCVVVASAAVLSCAAAPVKIATGDQCYGCRRSIRNARLASEIISGECSRLVSKFRGPGCLARYLADHPDEQGVVYVTDYASGKMMRPAKAFFVAEIVDHHTGEMEYRSYREESDARLAAGDLHTTVRSWTEVLEKAD